ncbi:MAG: alpha/beta fold hydrolase [Ktedonobacterales bacterium]
MPRPKVPWIQASGITAASVTASLAAGIAYSAVAIDHARPFAPAIEAERRQLRSAVAGELSYYASDHASGRPLLLVHSINAAASAYEMRPLFERYRGQRPVYALDLPGFGFSERSDRAYTPEVYTAALLDLLRELGAEREAADVAALSLGSEFAARAALRQREWVRSLTLISPTGLTDRAQRNRSERAGASPYGGAFYRLLRYPLWSQAFYDLVASRLSIRYFLQRSFVGAPDRGLVAYAYATAHQPGARFAPLAFLSGQLFSPDIREAVYERLSMPVLALYDQDAFVRFDALPDVLARNPRWQAIRLTPSKGLPQFERLDETARALDTFWQEVGASQAEVTPLLQ